MATRGRACIAAVLALACGPLVAGDAHAATSRAPSADGATSQPAGSFTKAGSATRHKRLSKEGLYRAAAHPRDLERAEAKRQEEQEYWAEQAYLEEEDPAEWEDDAPGPSLGDVLLEGLHALNDELARMLDQQAQRQAFLHNLQHQPMYLGGHHVPAPRHDRHRRDESRPRDRGPRGGGADHHPPRPPHRGR